VNRDPIPYQRIVFVCTHERTTGPRVSCGPRGGAELRQRLKELVKAHGLGDRIRISASGCMDLCEEGPNLMAFPGNRWVCGASPEDAERIFEQIREGL
jgi:(2Fe-2S) ferredoxin